jgi:rhodanese-related sulfurtransferase
VNLPRLLLALYVAPALVAAQVQLAGDDACARPAAEIMAAAACPGSRAAAPAAASSPVVAFVPLQDVAPLKRSESGRHVTSPEADRLRNAYPGRIALIDIRSRAEIAYAGRPDLVDVYVPFREPELPLQWNPATNGLKMQRNPHFADQVRAELARLDWPEDSVLLLLCRSGEMSAIAADVLQAAGLPQVVTVVDGFDGDLGPGGRRDVNGWKNSVGRWHLVPVERLAASTR